MTDPQPAPVVSLVRVVRGDPTAAELAALLCVLVAGGPAPEPERPAAAPGVGWTARAALVRGQLVPGPGAWRSGAQPKL